ncbi:sulfotransferase domain-containing protein [Candidatus Woesearchaeota archaeon]|nr:sulfotransferase domain-containing protein [Candidatus Woesearchaeota archaeon]
MLAKLQGRIGNLLIGKRSLIPFYKIAKSLSTKVIEKSRYDNIYHCCTQKTASQWLRAVFRDPVFYRYTALVVLPYIKVGLKEASFSRPFPKNVIATHLYIDYPTYLSIPKPKHYKAFVIIRDPRDCVVSWYFSAKKSHTMVTVIPKFRREMKNLGFDEGMKYIIDRLEELGSFDAQRSWLEAQDKRNIKIFRYEDLADDNLNFLKQLFNYLEIRIPEKEIIKLYNKYRFDRLAGGRKQGEEDNAHHFRKGVPGDWKNYFNKSVEKYFYEKTNDLLDVLGYKK